MQELQAKQPDAFNALTAALPADQQQALHTVSQMKDEDLAALAAEAAEAEALLSERRLGSTHEAEA